MPQSEPVAILLVNEIAEEIKLVTLSFRGFFPNCRVEAVYSLDEALQWGHRLSWNLILIDECLLAQRAPIFPELKRLAPNASLVLQTDRSDPPAALNALQAGADFLLYKKSPTFLTELLLYTKGAIEARAIRTTLERMQERHGRLIDTLTDVLYELDAEGRFVYLSPLTAELLGYAQDELIGAPYSVVVSSDQQDRARHCFNDRRTGARASRRVEIDLVRKASPDKSPPTRIRTEISAKGLYDAERRYLGTQGLLRDVSQQRRQEQTIHRLEHQLRETDRCLVMARRFSTLSKNLHVPHSAIQSQSQILLKTIRDAHLIEQVESLATYAAEAAHLGEELAQTAKKIAPPVGTINDIVDAVLAPAQPPLLNTDWIEQVYAPNLPPFAGNLDSLMQLLRILLSHAQRYVAAVGSRHRLRISTRAIGPNGAPIDLKSHRFPQEGPSEFEIHIQEIDAVATAEGPPIQATGDLFEAYALIKRLGGRWDFLAPVGGLLSVKVWIPAARALEPDGSPLSSTPPVSLEASAVEPTPAATPETSAPAYPTISLPSVQPLPSLPDRRKSIRTAVNLPARVTIGAALREGVMTNLSPGGASLDVEGLLPSLEQQPVYLLLKTAAGILKLHATAHDRGEAPPTDQRRPRTSRLALLFDALDDVQQKVLASSIEAARERTLAITVEALFSPPDITGNLAVISPETGLQGADHREAVRVRVALPVHIETSSRRGTAVRPLDLAVNFSRGGACLQTEPSLETTDDVVALHFSSIGARDQPRAHEPEAPEAILTGRIVHIAPDHTVPSELKPGLSQPGQRVGIRFSQPTPFAEREVNRVIAQHIGSSTDLAGIVGRSSIVSARRECRNARHQVIAVTDDHARHQISPGIPIVLIIPGFGSTQTDYLPLSFYLAANHLRVLRYDHTNHVGQSDGDILQITLRGMQADLESVLDFVHTTWPTAPVALLAEDIAARVAAKVMARSNSSSRLFLLNPVLHVETALSAVYRSDVTGRYRQGRRLGVANLWGLNVNLDQFIGDAIAGEYVDLASSTADLAQLATPPVILASPRIHRPIELIFGPQHQSLRAMGTALATVPLQADVSGESGAYDERHTTAFGTIFKVISTSLIGSPPSAQLHEPNPRNVHQQRQLEHERIRIHHHVSQATRSALWVAHLAQLPQLGNLPDYWALTNELYRRLLPLEPGMTILDIGCGQSDFARVMLTNQVYRSAHQSGPPVVPLRYIGLDQSHESLKLAQQRMAALAQELPGTLAAAVPTARLLETSWLHTDWNSPLPFINGSMKRILCHLSLSFSPSPLDCLRQTLRVLHQDGTAVVTCFQPHTDLSTLFHRHLRTAGQDELGSSAQIALHYLGRLREAIRHGLLHHYERNELAHLLAHAGAGPIQIFPVLDSQFLLAVVQKAESSTG